MQPDGRGQAALSAQRQTLSTCLGSGWGQVEKLAQASAPPPCELLPKLMIQLTLLQSALSPALGLAPRSGPSSGESNREGVGPANQAVLPKFNSVRSQSFLPSAIAAHPSIGLACPERGDLSKWGNLRRCKNRLEWVSVSDSSCSPKVIADLRRICSFSVYNTLAAASARAPSLAAVSRSHLCSRCPDWPWQSLSCGPKDSDENQEHMPQSRTPLLRLPGPPFDDTSLRAAALHPPCTGGLHRCLRVPCRCRERPIPG
jgi:hypothetical protein